MIDYTPTCRRPIRELPLGALFDTAALAEAAGERWVAGTADEELAMADCFAAGSRALTHATRDGNAGRIMRGLTAAPALRATAARIGDWLDRQSGGRFAAVQLRIERDWVAYLERREATRPDAVGRAMTDPDAIFGKVRRTPYMAGTTTLYACCDESDLGQSKAELKRLAAAHGLDLLFQSEAPGVALPSSTVAKAMVDFTLCQSVPVYIGLDRSTFSNALLQLKRWNGVEQRQYRYNSDHVILRLRS